MKTNPRILRIARRVTASRTVAASWLALCAMIFPSGLRAENLILDTFSWGAGTTRPGIASGSSLNNVTVEQQLPAGTRKWISPTTATFQGTSGPGNGSLWIGSGGRPRIDYTPSGKVTAVIDWADPGGSFGWQILNADAALLGNQNTNKVYSQLTHNATTGNGTLSLVCRINNVSASASKALPLTFNSTRTTLTIDTVARTAEATVQDQTTGRSAVVSVNWPAGNPAWQSFAINASNKTIYQCEVVELKKLPDQFPINMGFRPLEANQTVFPFNNLDNCMHFAVHHGAVGKMNNIHNEMIARNIQPPILTIAMNPTQVDGENRNNGVNSANTGKVWPGFWLQKVATKVTANLTTSATQIPVGNATGLIVVNNWIMISKLVPAGQPNAGRPAWLNLPSGVATGQPTGAYADTFKPYFEYAKVTAISADNKTLTVTRNMTGTTANSYTANQTVVAAMIPAWSLAEEEDSPAVISQFNRNISLNAPRHPGTGESAFEFWARGDVAALNAGLNDGRESDVQYCLTNPNADVDIDGAADGGFIDGLNNYLLGYQEFSRRVREGVGPEKIIQFDCIRARNGYRGWKYVNGIQMEGFGAGMGFSVNFDTLSQWAINAEYSPKFSYGLCKNATYTYDNGTFDQDAAFRKQFAVGPILGMPHPFKNLYDWDEQRGGKLDDYTWLGKPLGNYTRDTSQLGATNLAAGTTWNVSANTAGGYNATSTGTMFSTNGVQINVTAVPTGVPSYAGVYLKTQAPMIQLSAGQPYTLMFEAKANDTVSYNGKVYEGLPRDLRVERHGTGHMDLLVGANWRKYSLSFIAGNNTQSNPPRSEFQCQFDASETLGTTWIRNVDLRTGHAALLSRDFENGRVYLNESEGNWTVTPTGGIYRKLKGEIRPDLYTGNKVTGSITIAPHDAVFLSKNRFTDWFDRHTLGRNLTDTPPGTWDKLTPGYWTIVSEGSGQAAVAPAGGPQVSTVKTTEFNLGNASMGNAGNLDLQVDYKLTATGGAEHGVVFNLTGYPYSATNAYIFKAITGNNTAQIVKKTGSSEAVIFAGNCTTSIPVNEILHLRVKYTAAGGKIAATLTRADGSVLFSGNTNDTTYTTGTVGLYALQSSNYRVLKFDARARVIDP